MKSKTKICQNCKVKFIIEPKDFEFYKKIDVPEPTWCPECRMIRRFSFRNDHKLYKRKCDFSGKEIFAMFSPESQVKVYDSNILYSNEWDLGKYARDYNFNKPFFKQFQELRKQVPWSSRSCDRMINSDYCMNAQGLKDCYLVFSSSENEDCAYSYGLAYSNNCYDSAYLAKCELCYEVFESAGCYKTFFSSHCEGCRDVFFSTNCNNCQNCFGCINLRHKKYHIFNKPYTKEEYFKKLEEFNLGSYRGVLSLDKKAKEFWLEFPHRFAHSSNNKNVTGENTYNSKNVFDSYTISKSEDLRYCEFLFRAKDAYDYSDWGGEAELVYEVVSSGSGISKLKFCFLCTDNCRDMEYCVQCSDSSHLFGCVGLDHKQYCIFNKQYTKEEYNELVPQIKQHMNDMPYIDKKGRVYKYGEFFPTELSPFAYNETIVNEHFPLTKEQALSKGYAWYDKPKPEYKATIKASNLPDNIKDVDNSILKEVIECANCHSEST
ncbi:hypothetical protein KKE74_03685, partial [Patescibacteria group bacterium]|nr:hypothetical protein [Patescibacteria group bacterium]